MTFDSTCIMANDIGIVYNLHNKLWFLYIKAKMYAISSDTHQLHCIKLHHFKLERF